jgi:hypothetical protein
MKAEIVLELRPIQRRGEKTLAFYNRVNEWERRMKPLLKHEAASIDSCSKFMGVENPTTSGAKRTLSVNQRFDAEHTIHDLAQKNPLLAKVLRDLQKTHDYIIPVR